MINVLNKAKEFMEDYGKALGVGMLFGLLNTLVMFSMFASALAGNYLLTIVDVIAEGLLVYGLLTWFERNN